jgi:KTSC domain
MDRVPVESSVIGEVGYDVSYRTLEVMFRSGAIYLYYFVPQGEYDALMAADSKGTYFNKQIKGVYEHHRIAEPYDNPSKVRKRPTNSGTGKQSAGKPRERRPGAPGPSTGMRHR